VSTLDAGTLSAQLENGNVLLTTASGSGGSIIQQSGADISWTAPTMLGLRADAGITLQAVIDNPAGSASLIADNGNIEGAAATLKLASVYAEANGTDTVVGGKVNLTNSANAVGVIAGRVSGLAPEFRFVNSGSVRIGAVAGAYADMDGIEAQDWDSSSPAQTHGIVSVTANTGNVRVDAESWVDADGDILLKASGGDVVVRDGASVTSGSGETKLDASRDVLVARGVTAPSPWSTYLYGDKLTLVAGRNVELGTQSAVGAGNNPPEPYLAADTQITIQAGSDVLMGQPVGSTTTEPVPFVGVFGGNVDISAGGKVDFGLESEVDGYGGAVKVTAGTDILGRGYFYTNGGSLGSVTLTAQAGSVSFDAISADAYGDPSFDGGNVTVTAARDINAGSVSSMGYGVYDHDAGRGGAVSLISTDGNISLHSVNVDGGWGSDGFASGPGGSILLRAKGTSAGSGNITLSPSADSLVDAPRVACGCDGPGLTARGGSTDYFSGIASRGGDGGSIVVEGSGQVRIGDSQSAIGVLLEASGGSARPAWAAPLAAWAARCP